MTGRRRRSPDATGTARALLGDTHGAASVEYVIVLCLVCAGAALAVIALGPQLLELFLAQRSILLSPIP